MTTKVPLAIKKVNIVANWEFDNLSKECSLCRKLLISPSPQELNGKKKIISNQIVIGVCGHMFHKDCLTNFGNISNVCPVDKTPWKTSKTIKSGVIFEQQHVDIKTHTAT